MTLTGTLRCTFGTCITFKCPEIYYIRQPFVPVGAGYGNFSLHSVIYLNMAMFISLFTVYFHLCSHDHGMFKQLPLFKLICCDSLLNVLCLYFHNYICNLLDYNSDIRICISRNTFKNTSLIFMFSFLGLQQPHK